MLRMLGPVSHTVHSSAWTYSRNTRLCQLHRNDPGLLWTPIGLHLRGYMTSRERINMTLNIQEHKYKQTHIPVDIIYKFPGKLQTMQKIHLYSNLPHLADWLVHFPLLAPDPLTVLLIPGSILSALSLFKTKLLTELCLLLKLELSHFN